MKEFQFKIGNVWIDVNAEDEDQAVELLNSQLPLLDEPLAAPGCIQRIQLNILEPFSKKDIVSIFDLEEKRVCYLS